jgi:hypothetical protein
MKIILAALLLNLHTAAAAVISGDAVLTAPTPFGDYQLSLSQSIPSGQGSLVVTFNDLGGGVFGFNLAANIYSIAEEFRLYQAPLGAIFGADFVLTNPSLFSNAAPSNWSLSIPLNSSVTVAYWDDRTFIPSTPTSDDLYGWVTLTNLASGLVASSSATALGGGIVVGTVTQIPEPSTAGLLGTGTAFLLQRHRSQTKQNKALQRTARGWLVSMLSLVRRCLGFGGVQPRP